MRAMRIFAVLTALAVAPLPAAAEWYFGAKAVVVDVDIPGADKPTNVSFKVGKQWGVVLGDIGVEVEVSRTRDKGLLGLTPVEVDSEAVYLAFRSAGPVYLIARAGVARRDLTVGAVSDTDTDTSAGLGLGFSLGLFQIEIEATRLHENEDVQTVSLGIQF